MTPESRAVLIQWGWPKPCKPKCLNLGTSTQDDVILLLVEQQVAALQNYFAKNKLPPPRMGWNHREPNDGLGYIWEKLFQKESTEDIHDKTPAWKRPAESIRKKETSLMMQIAFGIEEQQNCSCPEHLKGLERAAWRSECSGRQLFIISAHWCLYWTFLFPAGVLGGGKHGGGAQQPTCSGKLPITLAVNLSIFLVPSANVDLWGSGCGRTVCDWV